MAFNEIMGYVSFAIGFWLAFEIWRAPEIDERNGRVIKPGKNLKDLFKRKK
jgi:hypothetical protein